MQEFTHNADIFPSVATDHSAITLSISGFKEMEKGPGLWKFNNSLIFDQNYITKLKNHIHSLKVDTSLDNNLDKQMKWEFIKYSIRIFTIKYSKGKAKEQKDKKQKLEQTLATLELDLSTSMNYQLYESCKNELEEIYDKIADGVKIRSRCDWYEEGEKSTKFFLNLEKHNASKTVIRKLKAENIEISDPKEILKTLQNYFEKVFQKNTFKTSKECDDFLRPLSTPTLNNDQINLSEGILTESELYDSMITMKNNKSPGNDGLSKEFYEKFWDDVKEPFINSIKEAKVKQKLSSSQRQAVIKLIEKKNKDKRCIENWRPISLLNVDYKILSKALASRLKKILPTLITSQQTAYISNRYIGENGRLISDIIEMTEKLNIGGFLVAMDIEKAFDSLDYTFLLSVLKKIGFKEQFINWIQILINSQESCVLNAGTTTPYFCLCKGARQGDPISPYLFILALEVLFILIKENKFIKGINIFEYSYLYTAYADDTTFFLKDEHSIHELVNTFNIYSTFSGLKPNFSKCEIAGIGVLKSVKVATCGMKSTDLCKTTMKVVGIHFSYDKHERENKNFYDLISSIQNVLKLWRMRNLSLEGKIVVFKTLALSKLIYLAQIINVPKSLVKQIKQIQKNFLWADSNPKIKHETLCLDFRNGGLRNCDIEGKIISLQILWLKRLIDENFHEWKLIPKNLMKKSFGSKFTFHANLAFRNSMIKDFPIFYKEILNSCKANFFVDPDIPSSIFSQFLWHNRFINVDHSSIYFEQFSEREVNFVMDLFDDQGNFLKWETFKNKFNCTNNMHFQWIQLVNAIPLNWKKKIKHTPRTNVDNLVVRNHHLIRNSNILPFDKLTSRDVYFIYISRKNHEPTSKRYFETLFENEILNWSKIYMLPRLTTINSTIRNFQYKILNNVLFLNKKLHLFGKSETSQCSYCKSSDEVVSHLFGKCNFAKRLWQELNIFFNGHIVLPIITPQVANFGFFGEIENKILINHVLLLFKHYIYRSREAGVLDINNLIKYIYKVKKIEKQLSFSSVKKNEYFNKKWGETRRKKYCYPGNFGYG